jgi:hypothetical protein
MIRSKVFGKMWVVAAALLFLCAFVESGIEVQWAAAHWQVYIIIAAISFTYGGIELLLRGAYFERNGMIGRAAPYFIGACALVGTVLRIISLANGEMFISGGTMTEDGGFLVIDVLLLVLGAVGAVKSRQLRRDRDKPADE